VGNPSFYASQGARRKTVKELSKNGRHLLNNKTRFIRERNFLKKGWSPSNRRIVRGHCASQDKGGYWGTGTVHVRNRRRMEKVSVRRLVESMTSSRRGTPEKAGRLWQYGERPRGMQAKVEKGGALTEHDSRTEALNRWANRTLGE